MLLSLFFVNAGMATPPSNYKGMQTRSKTEAISETTRKSAKRPLFPEEQPESKKKKTKVYNMIVPNLLMAATTQ